MIPASGCSAGVPPTRLRDGSPAPRRWQTRLSKMSTARCLRWARGTWNSSCTAWSAVPPSFWNAPSHARSLLGLCALGLESVLAGCPVAEQGEGNMMSAEFSLFPMSRFVVWGSCFRSRLFTAFVLEGRALAGLGSIVPFAVSKR